MYSGPGAEEADNQETPMGAGRTTLPHRKSHLSLGKGQPKKTEHIRY